MFGGLVQDYCISVANTLKISNSCTDHQNDVKNDNKNNLCESALLDQIL